jgi:hypothetical protein
MPRKKHLQLSIPQPCQSGWATMHPIGKDQFCKQCQKVIVDFSRRTDAEIGLILSQPNAPTCGRFRRSQLDRPITYEVQQSQRSWPHLAAGAVVLMLAMPHALLAQAPVVRRVEAVAQAHPQPQVADNRAASPPTGEDSVFVLKGHLTQAETGEGIAFANVVNLEMGIKTITDASGDFVLLIPQATLQDTLQLQVRWFGDLHVIQIAMDRTVSEMKVSVALEMQEVLLDGIMIREFEPPKAPKLAPRKTNR